MTDFTFFSPIHLIIIFLTFTLPVIVGLFIRWARADKADVILRWSLVTALIGSKLVTVSVTYSLGKLEVSNILPMHMCDWVLVFSCLALVLKERQLLFELSYFWGLTGTLQGVVTPNFQVLTSDPRFYTFFIGHCGIIFAILYLVVAKDCAPRKGSWWKAWLWLQVYTVSAIAANYLTGGNYGYLAHKPESASLLDALGLWPWYIVGMEIISLAAFALLYAPMRMLGRCREESTDYCVATGR